MNKSELMDSLGQKNPSLSPKVIEDTVKHILEKIMLTLEEKERVEIRGFGSFSLHYREPRLGRNPKNGDKVTLNAKYVPHFKAGKELKERVNFI